MRIFQESIGDYSQTIRISSVNEVEVSKNGKILFKGEATNIIDTWTTLSFKDEGGKRHEFLKRVTNTYA